MVLVVHELSLCCNNLLVCITAHIRYKTYGLMDILKMTAWTMLVGTNKGLPYIVFYQARGALFLHCKLTRWYTAKTQCMACYNSVIIMIYLFLHCLVIISQRCCLQIPLHMWVCSGAIMAVTTIRSVCKCSNLCCDNILTMTTLIMLVDTGYKSCLFSSIQVGKTKNSKQLMTQNPLWRV